MYKIFNPPKAGLQIFLTPSPLDLPPTAGLKMTNPYHSIKTLDPKNISREENFKEFSVFGRQRDSYFYPKKG